MHRRLTPKTLQPIYLFVDCNQLTEHAASCHMCLSMLPTCCMLVLPTDKIHNTCVTSATNNQPVAQPHRTKETGSDTLAVNLLVPYDGSQPLIAVQPQAKPTDNPPAERMPLCNVTNRLFIAHALKASLCRLSSAAAGLCTLDGQQPTGGSLTEKWHMPRQSSTHANCNYVVYLCAIHSLQTSSIPVISIRCVSKMANNVWALHKWLHAQKGVIAQCSTALLLSGIDMLVHSWHSQLLSRQSGKNRAK